MRKKGLDNGRAPHYIVYNLIVKTVDAEITVMMLPQRACGAESQAEHKSSNGPPRVQSKGAGPSILQRVGIRQLPGIWTYPAKRTEVP